MFSNKEEFKDAFLERLELIYGESINDASKEELYAALGTMIREYLTKDWVEANKAYKTSDEKEVFYFSIEFLLGRLLYNNLLNLGIFGVCSEGLKDLGIDIEELEEVEPDPGLGNGGLGRLAACFLDSLTSLGMSGHGCSIRYRYGLFEQKIVDGCQVEFPEYWLREGNVWEIRKFDNSVVVKFGGDIRVEQDGKRLVFHHENYEAVLAVPYDIPITGYRKKNINTLRLWNAESALDEFDAISMGYDSPQKIMEYKHSTEAISQFLYPDDSYYEGKVLRLKQEYFFVSAGVQSIIRRHKKKYGKVKNLPDKVAIHINDTHPALAVPELMRILMDEEGMGWEEAFDITVRTISYTNHTTMVEALETWPVTIFKPLLPRIFMIIEEMNERFCRSLWEKYPGDWDRISQMAIIGDNHVRMAHLAIVGSHSVNGVAKVHTNILKRKEMKKFYEVFSWKFNNKTNGITHRRWLLYANPCLSELVTRSIGTGWISQPSKLLELRDYAEDPSFQEEIKNIKHKNKESLAKYIKENNGVTVDPDSIFDVHIKRIHEYKRQLLNVLHILHLYRLLKEDPDLDIWPRTFIFSGKSAPGYSLAKEIIRLITTTAEMINSDNKIKDKIKVLFLENYCVSLAEKIIPAADVSEQISTASKEASGTGNMKLMMNGAATLGTLDGANIEILEEVGSDNMFIFGLSPSEVLSYYEQGGYTSLDVYRSDERIREVVDSLVGSGFVAKRCEDFREIYNSLLAHNDQYFVLKDFASYADIQRRLDQTYREDSKWQKMCIINIAGSGRFSSDYTISKYSSGVWKLNPIVVN